MKKKQYVPTINGAEWEAGKWTFLFPEGDRFFILKAFVRNIETKKFQYFEKAYVSNVVPDCK